MATSKRTLYYVGKNHYSEAEVFADMFDEVKCHPINIASNISYMTKDDVIILGGGEDISPAMYEAEPSQFNFGPPSPSERDIAELNIIYEARIRKIPVIGICRGAQMLGVATNNTLVQHVTGHGRDHDIFFTNYAKVNLVIPNVDVEQWYPCLSSHHQMVYRTNDYIIPLMFSPPITKVLVFSDTKVVNMQGDLRVAKSYPELEMFVGTKHRLLGIQGHPEYGHIGHPFTDLCRNIVRHYLNEWK